MLWHTNIQLPNQLEMPQRILNILHLLLWTPLYLWILFLRLIVILAYVQTTHPLHLCNIRSMHIHTILILHIFLNLLISSLLLWCIIPLFFKLHHNLLHIISRQQYHRLNMCRYSYRNTFYQPRYYHVNTIHQFCVVPLHFFFVV